MRPALGLRTRWLVPLFGINFEATSKNREIGGALALGGRCSNYKYIQQSNGSWHPGWGMYWGGSKAGAERVGGARSRHFCRQTERQKQRKIKLHIGLRRPPFEILPHNNQPKTCVHARWWYKGVVQMEWDSGGGVLCNVLAAIKRQYIRKNKIIHWVY